MWTSLLNKRGCPPIVPPLGGELIGTVMIRWYEILFQAFCNINMILPIKRRCYYIPVYCMSDCCLCVHIPSWESQKACISTDLWFLQPLLCTIVLGQHGFRDCIYKQMFGQNSSASQIFCNFESHFLWYTLQVLDTATSSELPFHRECLTFLKDFSMGGF